MVLGISEDFTSDVVLDSQLKAVPDSGLYLNSGVHASITVDNLLNFLPNLPFTFTAWNNATTYGVFLTTRNKTDIVSKNSKIFQSIKATNLNQDPEEADSIYWVETNIESLRLKIFIEKVKDRVYSELSLTKRLINSQLIYENGKTEKTLPNDYAAWVLEPKGSDYVTIKVNQIAIQADGTTPIDVYVLSQDELQETVSITPSNGQLVFRDTNIVLSGKGAFKLAIDSQDVYVGHATIDPLKFNGFVAYTANGTGEAPESATYTYNTFGIGMGINVSAYLDASQYIESNIDSLANFIRVVFELMTFEMFLANSHNRSNKAERIQLDTNLLVAETKNMQAETVIRRFHREKKKAVEAMERTFDTQLNNHDGFKIKVGSV